MYLCSLHSFSRNAKTTKGLFDEDDEDDLFGAASKPKATPTAAATKAKVF